jgi:hypothetical protein
VTVWRWGTSGVPGLSAFMPSISKTAGTWQAYKQAVTGQPGTQAIPMPNNSNPQDRYQVSADHRSSDAPPFIYPQLWFEDQLPGLPFPAGANDCGVQIYSDNQLPVPAIDPTRGTFRLGGGQAVTPAMNTYRRPVVNQTVQLRYG